METVKQLIINDLTESFKVLGVEAVGEILVPPVDLNLADFTCNLCFRLAREAKCTPNVLADKVTEAINSKYTKSEQNEYIMYSKSGYINFTVADKFKLEWLESVQNNGFDEVLEQSQSKKKICLEFISANPTGPLTLANGRAGFLGDALANLLIIMGHQVTREYYVNDAGNQIKILGQSVKAKLGLVSAEENFYQGEYVSDLAEKFKDQSSLSDEEFGRLLANYLLETEIRPVIENSMGIKMDNWVSEYNDIREAGLMDNILKKLKETPYIYESEGATWLKTTDFGDDKDRVLIKADGEMTYFLVDIAYHYRKIMKGADKMITILGADHYGYVTRLGAGLQALGYLSDMLEIVILQMIKLYQGGVEVKMSKRAGNYVLMQQALDEVPADLLRFYLLSYNPNSQVDIDLDALSSKNDKNPVYSVQYMFARIHSILEKTAGLDTVVNGEEKPGPSWQRLFRELYYLPLAVERAALNYQPNILTGQVLSLALAFHKFYENERVIVADKLISNRLIMIKALSSALAQALNILGISAPEKMAK